ncbi:MAG: SDR family oxidoreductase [Pseudomonadota bacterium]
MPNILITGGSDGIGRALVDHYTHAGGTVFATGRRKKADVSPALPPSCHYIAADLTQDLTAIQAALPETLDLAILNAGAGRVAPPAEHGPESIKAMVALNTTAPLLLAQALYPRLKASRGTLVFIGSTAARGAHKDFAVYAATKAALDGAYRSLRLEWEGAVTVLMIHPGPTATAMHDKAGLPQIAARKLFTNPATVAATIAKAAARGKSRRLGLGYTLRHALAGGRR